jgi:hypothetical protein
MSTGGDYCGPQFIFMMIYIQRIYIFVEYVCVCLCTVQCCRYPDWREAASDDRHLGLHTTEEPMSSTCTSRCLKSWLKNTGLLNWMFWGLFNILMMIKFLCPYFPFRSTSPNVSSTLRTADFTAPLPNTSPDLSINSIALVSNWSCN